MLEPSLLAERGVDMEIILLFPGTGGRFDWDCTFIVFLNTVDSPVFATLP